MDYFNNEKKSATFKLWFYLIGLKQISVQQQLFRSSLCKFKIGNGTLSTFFLTVFRIRIEYGFNQVSGSGSRTAKNDQEK